MIRYTNGDPKDTDLVIAAMYRMWSLNPNNQMVFTDERKSLDYITKACEEGNVAIVDETFAIMFQVGCSWYHSAPFLFEECFLRIQRNKIPVAVGIAALDMIRVEKGAVMTIVGDTQVGVMTPHYIAAGYRPAGTQLIKD